MPWKPHVAKAHHQDLGTTWAACLRASCVLCALRDAAECGAALHVLTASDVYGAYVGQSERRLREAFEAAARDARRGKVAVVFLDEVSARRFGWGCSPRTTPVTSSDADWTWRRGEERHTQSLARFALLTCPPLPRATRARARAAGRAVPPPRRPARARVARRRPTAHAAGRGRQPNCPPRPPRPPAAAGACRGGAWGRRRGSSSGRGRGGWPPGGGGRHQPPQRAGPRAAAPRAPGPRDCRQRAQRGAEGGHPRVPHVRRAGACGPGGAGGGTAFRGMRGEDLFGADLLPT